MGSWAFSVGGIITGVLGVVAFAVRAFQMRAVCDSFAVEAF
jgi:hypothetical protein